MKLITAILTMMSSHTHKMVGVERKNGAHGGIGVRKGAERKERTENVRAWKLWALPEM